MALVNLNKTGNSNDLDIKTVNNIKSLGIDMINSANSGHPGIVLGAAPILFRLYNKHLVFDYNNPSWINRDRFVMSAGHGSALLYATLFMSGFDLTINDLKEFRKYDSKTPGHPEVFVTPGVDCSTGPLGQGFASAVGMAIGEAYLNQKFKYLRSSLIDHYTYVFVSDGDLMEGVSFEAAAIAGELSLSKLIVLYDSNGISLDGSTDGVLDYDILKEFRAMGWDTHSLDNAYDFDGFDELIYKSKKSMKPSIIKITTVIGKDSENQNSNLVHGKPLSKDDIKKLKKKLGIRDIPYTVLSDASNYMKNSIDERNNLLITKWEKTCDRLRKKLDKDIISQYDNLLSGCEIALDYDFSFDKKISGREALFNILNRLSSLDMMCLLTDTSSSTKVYFDKESYFSKSNRKGKNIKCGVREFACSSIQNGLALMNIKTISSTFLSFSNYMIPSIRMASLMGLNTVYVFTHDSVLVGEDGPTHQPIEQIDMLRLIPGVTVFRPFNTFELIDAFKYSFNSNGPSVIVVSKDKISVSNNPKYIIRDNDKASLCIISSGSEVDVALSVSKALEKHMVFSRVVSMPSTKVFDELSLEEQEKILPKNMTKVVLELSTCACYYKYLSSDSLVFNVNCFMKSGNKYSIINRLGYDVDTITNEIAKAMHKK